MTTNQSITDGDLTIYELDGERVIAADDGGGRLIASEVMGGSRAGADAARPTGLTVAAAGLTDEQRRHLRRHGWCVAE